MVRIITAVCIVVFFAAVQPSEVPPMWIIAALSIGGYEIISQAAALDRRAQRRRTSGAAGASPAGADPGTHSVEI